VGSGRPLQNRIFSNSLIDDIVLHHGVPELTRQLLCISIPAFKDPPEAFEEILMEIITMRNHSLLTRLNVTLEDFPAVIIFRLIISSHIATSLNYRMAVSV
jgi:hypothetical protein